MSAIPKPFINPTLTVNGDGGTVPVEQISSIDDSVDNTITFNMQQTDTIPPHYKWKYADNTLRDADMATITAAISLAIV